MDVDSYHMMAVYGHGYLNGTHGFIAHWGHIGSYNDPTSQSHHVWVNARWFNNSVRMQISNINHNFIVCTNPNNETVIRNGVRHQILRCTVTGVRRPEAEVAINGWAQGGLRFDMGATFAQNRNRHCWDRIRFDSLISVLPNRRYTFFVPAGFQLAVHEYDANHRFVRDNFWQSGNFMVTTRSDTRFIALMLRRTGDIELTPRDVLMSNIIFW